MISAHAPRLGWRFGIRAIAVCVIAAGSGLAGCAQQPQSPPFSPSSATASGGLTRQPPMRPRLELLSPGPEWIKGGGNEETRAVEWVHLRSRVRSGNVVQAWSILNFADRTSYGAMSQRVRIEWDCARSANRSLHITAFDQYNARGNSLFSQNTTDRNWVPMAPETSGFATLQIVCGR